MSLKTSLYRHIFRRYLATSSSTSKVSVGIVLTRPPILTSPPSPFESAYLQYKEHISHTENRPFDPSFFIRKGSMAEKRWTEAQEQHQEEVDAYLAKHSLQGNEEVVVDVQPRDPESDSIPIKSRDVDPEVEKDLKSLDRKMTDPLFLVVKNKSGGDWSFPVGEIKNDELLHEAASHRIKDTLGSSMDTWVVGRVPIGAVSTNDTNTFFMKAHIFAGKVSPNKSTVSDYAWMTKDELSSAMRKDVFESVSGMLSQ